MYVFKMELAIIELFIICHKILECISVMIRGNKTERIYEKPAQNKIERERKGTLASYTLNSCSYEYFIKPCINRDNMCSPDRTVSMYKHIS